MNMDGYHISARASLAKGKFIADSLYRTCVAPDGGQRLKETGSIAPAGSLKCLAARHAFQWASKVSEQSRFYTLAACRMGVKLLLEYPGVQVPLLGTIPLDLWIEQQAKMVMHLCGRARRNSGSATLRFPAYRQARSMDWEETLPMQD